MRGKCTSPQGDILNSISKLNFFFFFTGCKIQAGSPACGRRTHRRSGGGPDWPPCRLQSGRNCSCARGRGVGLHRWKTDTKKETENDGEARFQLSRPPQQNWQKMQLKSKLQYCWCRHIYPNDDLRCCWTPRQLSEHDYIQIVAVDAQWDWTVIRGCILLFAGALMEMWEIEEPGLRAYNICQIKFKNCQGADFLLGNVKTKPITLIRTCDLWICCVMEGPFSE